MSKRYVRPTIGGWLVPTLIAPYLSVYGSVAAIVTLGMERGVFGKMLGWVVGLTVGTVWAFLFCTMLVVVDLLLLGVRVRTLPSGGRGWLTALLSPLAVFGIYAVAPPYSFYSYGPWAVLGAVLVPMLGVALATRVFAGARTLN